MSDIEDSPGGADEYSNREINVALAAETLRRVGMVMLYVGGFGVFVWAFETYSTWDTVNNSEGFSDGGLSRQLAVVLGHVGTLLLAALVSGIGSACRLLADWATLYLTEVQRNGTGAGPSSDM